MPPFSIHVVLDSWSEPDPSETLSGLNAQFLRGLLTLGQLQQRNTLSGEAMSAEQVYHTYVALPKKSNLKCKPGRVVMHHSKTLRLFCVCARNAISVAVLTAQSASRCVCSGSVSAQLEWVLLDAHFALLRGLIQEGERQAKVVGAAEGQQRLVARRCRALTALIRLTSISPCQELLDMQERVRVRQGNIGKMCVFF